MYDLIKQTHVTTPHWFDIRIRCVSLVFRRGRSTERESMPGRSMSLAKPNKQQYFDAELLHKLSAHQCHLLLKQGNVMRSKA
jgi:hypothetical protein